MSLLVLIELEVLMCDKFKPCIMEFLPILINDIDVDHMYENDRGRDIDFKWKSTGMYLLQVGLDDYDFSNYS
jgi:hypothetical protein